MYLPPHFEVTDRAALHALLRQHPLATWATVADGQPVVNHVPFLLDETDGEHGTLIGHVARANPVWRQPAPSVLAFHGPDAYVSPSWLPAKREHGKVVPTWNYAVVHAHGVPQPVEDADGLLAIVTRLTARHESSRPSPWAVADAPAAYIEQMLRAIVGVRIPVQRWVGKFKLSQNHPAASRDGVRSGLRATDPHDPLADLMERHSPR